VGDPRPFREYDLVVITKKVPTEWIVKAKKGVIEQERMLQVAGGAADIAQTLTRVIEEWGERKQKG
jgi:hypothetical protein